MFTILTNCILKGFQIRFSFIQVHLNELWLQSSGSHLLVSWQWSELLLSAIQWSKDLYGQEQPSTFLLAVEHLLSSLKRAKRSQVFQTSACLRNELLDTLLNSQQAGDIKDSLVKSQK